MVFRCGHCGRWGTKQVKEITKSVYKCFYCNKTRKCKLSRQFGISMNFIIAESGIRAAEICAEKNLNGR